MKYVYLLRTGEFHFKVGVAVNVAKRVAGLQTSNALPVQVIACRLVEDAFKMEKEIHQQLRGMQAGGGTEWYRLTAEEALDLAVLINQTPELDLTERVTLTTQLMEQRICHARIEEKLDKLIESKKPVEATDESLAEPKTKQVADNAIIEAALTIIRAEKKASTSLLQRRLSIGYGRAARVIEQLEEEGFISGPDGLHARVVLK